MTSHTMMSSPCFVSRSAGTLGQKRCSLGRVRQKLEQIVDVERSRQDWNVALSEDIPEALYPVRVRVDHEIDVRGERGRRAQHIIAVVIEATVERHTTTGVSAILRAAIANWEATQRVVEKPASSHAACNESLTPRSRTTTNTCVISASPCRTKQPCLAPHG